MHLGLRKMNKDRRAGKLDEKWNALTDDQKWIQGDLRPDFMYVL
jgi:hypothetical protein